MIHTILYDAGCSFCQRQKSRIERLDKNHLFIFKPQEPPSSSIVLIESTGKTSTQSKAVLRILWLLGYYFPGCFYILPGWSINWIYNLIARHRHQL